jgi:hypothetical protein
MMFPLSARLLLAALAVALAGQAAALSPDASSDAVLTARTDPQGELRVKYQKDVDGQQRQVLTVGLARDYDYVQSPAERTIRDYRLLRVLRYQPAFVSTYVNDSLYADVWYRAAEVERRSQQVGEVKEAGTGPQRGLLTLSPFWAESELGVATRAFPRPMLSRKDQAGRSSWTLGGLEVLAVRWHEQPVPAEVQGGLHRFWFALAPAHPQIVEELASAGRMPDELWVEAPAPDGKHLQRLHWVLSDYQWVSAAPYPLGAHLRAAPTESSGAYPEIFGTLSAAVAKRLEPPAEHTYLDKVQSAISQGEGLQALLWVQEMRLAQGSSPECLPNDRRPACALMQVATSLAENDPRTDVAFGQQSPPQSLRAAFGDLPNAYLLGLLWAARPPGAKVTFAESEQGVLAALKARPVAGFCKDAGDFYANAWKAKAAWQIWDLGRLMAGHRKGDVLEQIDGLEASLAQDYPGFF